VIAGLRYRRILAVGHTFLDFLLLSVWIWHCASLVKNEKHARIIAPAMLLQDDSGVGWDPIYTPPPPEFMLLATGSMPAGMVSMSLRPKAWRVTRHKLWDPVWFLLHESLAVPFWFLIGWRIDLGRSQLRKLMLFYLPARCGLGGRVGEWPRPDNSAFHYQRS
jgi:hypothetical protein